MRSLNSREAIVAEAATSNLSSIECAEAAFGSAVAEASLDARKDGSNAAAVEEETETRLEACCDPSSSSSEVMLPKKRDCNSWFDGVVEGTAATAEGGREAEAPAVGFSCSSRGCSGTDGGAATGDASAEAITAAGVLPPLPLPEPLWFRFDGERILLCSRAIAPKGGDSDGDALDPLA